MMIWQLGSSYDWDLGMLNQVIGLAFPVFDSDLAKFKITLNIMEYKRVLQKSKS